jgi:hypothetical protein
VTGQPRRGRWRQLGRHDGHGGAQRQAGHVARRAGHVGHLDLRLGPEVPSAWDTPAAMTPLVDTAGRDPGGYDSAANRAWLRHRGIRARIARRGVDCSARLGRHRWKVERFAVLVELLQAAAGALGSGFGTLVGVCVAGLCGRLLQPARTLEGVPHRSAAHQAPQRTGGPAGSDALARSMMLPGANRSMKPSTAARRVTSPSPGVIRTCSP